MQDLFHRKKVFFVDKLNCKFGKLCTNVYVKVLFLFVGCLMLDLIVSYVAVLLIDSGHLFQYRCHVFKIQISHALFSGMVLIPMIMNKLDSKGLFKRYPKANAPLQVALVGLILTFATPLCCAIFEQKASINVSDVEPHIQEKLKSLQNPPKVLYYNKGL